MCQHIGLAVQIVNWIFAQFGFKIGSTGLNRFELLVKGIWNGKYLR